MPYLIGAARHRVVGGEVATQGQGYRVLAATLFAHDPAGFDVHVPAGLGGDVLGLGGPGEAGEQALLAGARPPGLGPAW